MTKSNDHPPVLEKKELADVIMSICKEKSIYGKDVCAHMGWPINRISIWRTNSDRARYPYFSEIIKVAEYLDVPYQLLVFGEAYEDYVLVSKEKIRRIAGEVNGLID